MTNSKEKTVNYSLFVGILALILTVWIHAYSVQADNRSMIFENRKTSAENKVCIDMLKAWMTRIDNKIDRIIEQTK